MRNAAVIDEATRLYEEARRRLLKNEPLRGESGESAARTLSAGEVDALKAVGLATELFDKSFERDPLTQSIADYMALLETSYSTAQAAKYLKVDASRVRQRLREHSLFGIDYDGEKRLPRFQFERQHVIPGLREVLAALPKELNPIDVAEWFLSPNPDLEIDAQETPLSPREWLLQGQAVGPVVALAGMLE
ncbi:MAG TPA: hypothetical protein VK652_03510 [Steroidobacteraceae bacterium]|nr:hypothetical protein [Steroidobacteraceae bacterium]